MSHRLKFEEDALAEWMHLDKSVRDPLKKKLDKRLKHPRVENQRLHGLLKDCYKIKHDKTGHRLIYQVIDDEVIVLVLAIGRRENLEAYFAAEGRLSL